MTAWDVDPEIEALRAQKDQAYAERNKCVAMIARMAQCAGYGVYLGRHSADDAAWERDWMNIVFIELPTGQVSWHIHDSELPLFAFMPIREDWPWDGHSTEEKYDRMRRWMKQVEP